MRILLLLSVLLSSLLGSAQERKVVQLQWKSQTASPFYTFESAVNSAAGYEMPNYCGLFSLDGAVVTADLNLEVRSTEAVSAAEAAALSQFDIGAEAKLSSQLTSHKGRQYVSYCVEPYVRRNGQYLRLTEFALNLAPKANNTERLGKTTAQQFTTTSVLSSGDWFKFSVSESGLFKLTAQLLSEAGLENPQIANLRVVGNGIGMLPEPNFENRPDDLLDIPFRAVDKNSNGILDGGDYLQFYFRGPHQWLQNTAGDFFHRQNIYRDKNFFFVSANAGAGTRVGDLPANTATPTVNFSTYDDYQFIEDERFNLVATGRVWVGDVFDFTKSRNYTFIFNDLDQSVPAKLRVNVVGRASTSTTSMLSSYNGNTILTNPIPAYTTIFSYNDFVQGSFRSSEFTLTAPNNITLNLTYNNSANPTGVAWLDYIEVLVKRNLINRGVPLVFRNKDNVGSGAVAAYSIQNATASTEVWEVTDLHSTRRLSTQLNGNVLSFTVAHDSLREFVAFTGENGLKIPTFVEKVDNQNLHALQGLDMLIVSHANFMESAEQLAELHRQQQNMQVEVVDVAKIYNEFSSGGQDITAIRDMARMLYERGNAQGKPFKYLFLFGDASYDYKDRITNNDNYVPIYQGGGSFNLGNSWISDDYYALLDPSEGGQLNSAFLDIGVGRVPVRNSGQGSAYVNKVRQYTERDTRFGDWRNRVMLIADDMDLDWEGSFVQGSEYLANRTNQFSEAFNIDKVYSDSYTQQSTTGGQSYPEAKQEIFRKVNAGNLITNYIGHGGEIGLASEGLIDLNDVNSFRNLENLPLFITITCEFTRVDDPNRVSAGERLITNSQGGVIGSISTTRVVGEATGISLNRSIFDTIFARPNNEPMNLGDIISAAKNGQMGNPDRLKFSLFGDPAIALAIPYYNVVTTQLNGVDINNPSLDTLKAGSKVEVRGEVRDFGDQRLNDFSGELFVTVYDKPAQRKTLQNDAQAVEIQFETQNNQIYRGKVSVTNGSFQFAFIVPQDISFRFGPGKFSYYATNSQTDAAGASRQAIVGGFSQDSITDVEGPEVQLYLNDASFVRGGITGRDPDLFALIVDSSGVNTIGSGVGHDLVAVLDGKTDQSFVLNEYYEADLNSFQSGSVRYPFFDLEEGEHTLELRVFDVFNNRSVAQTEFIVAESEEFVLRRLLNYPNPFTTYTEFQFEHNRANVPLEVQVQVFTVSGQLVKTINRSITPTGNRVTGIDWNGLDDYGDKIGKGVYVYRVKVRSTLDNSSAEEYEKLVILR